MFNTNRYTHAYIVIYACIHVSSYLTIDLSLLANQMCWKGHIVCREERKKLPNCLLYSELHDKHPRYVPRNLNKDQKNIFKSLKNYILECEELALRRLARIKTFKTKRTSYEETHKIHERLKQNWGKEQCQTLKFWYLFRSVLFVIVFVLLKLDTSIILEGSHEKRDQGTLPLSQGDTTCNIYRNVCKSFLFQKSCCATQNPSLITQPSNVYWYFFLLSVINVLKFASLMLVWKVIWKEIVIENA